MYDSSFGIEFQKENLTEIFQILDCLPVQMTRLKTDPLSILSPR
jgi:hypothetical protein